MDINQSDRRRTYPQDLLRNFPPKQEGKSVRNSRFSAFAISLQGASHVQKEVPCQDYSDVRILDECGIIIGGIADGVGSCPLSHWGAYIAVSEALNYVEDQIRGHETAFSGEELHAVLYKAFCHAEDMVARAADAAMQAVRNLQSTLTVAVYDGSNLYCYHVGDDGVVVQQRDGIVKLATNRLKGEEASSVYPLQSGRGKWEFTKVRNAVAGFVMATDGVLDAFAMTYPINYFNRIYYPFMEPAMYRMLDKTVPNAARNTLEYYRQYLKSPGYRAKVTDDLTLVAVTAPAVLAKSARPAFSVDTWNAMEREHEQKKAEVLGYSVSQRGKASEKLPEYPSGGRVPQHSKSAERPQESPARTPEHQVRRLDTRFLAEEEQMKKKSYRNSLENQIFFLKIVIAGLTTVLIAVIVGFSFLYFRKCSATDNTEEEGELNQKIEQRNPEIWPTKPTEEPVKYPDIEETRVPNQETEQELPKTPNSRPEEETIEPKETLKISDPDTGMELSEEQNEFFETEYDE